MQSCAKGKTRLLSQPPKAPGRNDPKDSRCPALEVVQKQPSERRARVPTENSWERAQAEQPPDLHHERTARDSHTGLGSCKQRRWGSMRMAHPTFPGPPSQKDGGDRPHFPDEDTGFAMRKDLARATQGMQDLTNREHPENQHR